MIVKVYAKKLGTKEIDECDLDETLVKTGLTEEQMLVLLLSNNGKFTYGKYEFYGCAS